MCTVGGNSSGFFPNSKTTPATKGSRKNVQLLGGAHSLLRHGQLALPVNAGRLFGINVALHLDAGAVMPKRAENIACRTDLFDPPLVPDLGITGPFACSLLQEQFTTVGLLAA